MTTALIDLLEALNCDRAAGRFRPPRPPRGTPTPARDAAVGLGSESSLQSSPVRLPSRMFDVCLYEEGAFGSTY